MPYRKRDVEERREPDGESGVVGDLVRQFADPYAFFRELVQNAIDAGSGEIAVRVDYEHESAVIRVDDFGEGMTRDIIENKLTKLFASSKDNDFTQIWHSSQIEEPKSSNHIEFKDAEVDDLIVKARKVFDKAVVT